MYVCCISTTSTLHLMSPCKESKKKTKFLFRLHSPRSLPIPSIYMASERTKVKPGNDTHLIVQESLPHPFLRRARLRRHPHFETQAKTCDSSKKTRKNAPAPLLTGSKRRRQTELRTYNRQTSTLKARATLPAPHRDKKHLRSQPRQVSARPHESPRRRTRVAPMVQRRLKPHPAHRGSTRFAPNMSMSIAFTNVDEKGGLYARLQAGRGVCLHWSNILLHRHSPFIGRQHQQPLEVPLRSFHCVWTVADA